MRILIIILLSLLVTHISASESDEANRTAIGSVNWDNYVVAETD